MKQFTMNNKSMGCTITMRKAINRRQGYIYSHMRRGNGVNANQIYFDADDELLLFSKFCIESPKKDLKENKICGKIRTLGFEKARMQGK